MRWYRFVVSDDFNKKYIRIIDPVILNQWQKVLRFKSGDEVILVNGQNKEAITKIISINNDFAEGEIIEVRDNQNEPQIETILYCAILKNENFEWVVQKATEIGVKEIVPLITKRTIKLNLRKDRLEKICQEATEQSGRGMVPIINNPIKFEEVVRFAKNNDVNIFCDPNGEIFHKNIIKSKSKIGIFIGPEGGWDEDEMFIAKHNDFKIISLGKLILRAETAAIIASYLVINS
ncbi:MAG: 16S rRNA (uracil(1498)-N(3))-methyltransferase [Parcubacteria group bacterium]|nr:16S rRNA (uracil(1498)-N(3))-methyltransferase [Parcubacteria group bacterium]